MRSSRGLAAISFSGTDFTVGCYGMAVEGRSTLSPGEAVSVTARMAGAYSGSLAVTRHQMTAL